MSKGQVGRIFFSRFSEGEDLIDSVKKRAEEDGVRTGVFILIGSLKSVVLGYFRDGEYKNIEINGPLEIASCMGNISADDKGETIIHAHIVVSDNKGRAFGGHLMKGSFVDATAELVTIEATGLTLKKVFDAKTKLKLWELP